MANPNKCENCEHKAKPEGGWCYMFSVEPTDQCMQFKSNARSSGGSSTLNDAGTGFAVLEVIGAVIGSILD